MSIAIIANPLAGRGRGYKTAQLAQEILATEKVDFQLFFTEYTAHATELAQKASKNHEVVVALGGDGTIREVIEGLWQSSATLGIIPGGTGNDYARGLQIPRVTSQAIEVLKQQHSLPFDLGQEGEQIFGVAASLGFSVDVLEHVNNHRDGLWKGQAAFIAGAVATIRDLRTYPIRLRVDGLVLEKKIVALFVMNMPYSGGGMKFTPEAHFSDGLFNILLIEEINKLDLAYTLPKVYSGKHIHHPAVTILTGKEVEIESEPLPLMLDGDIFTAQTSFKTRLISQAIPVVVPKTPACLNCSLSSGQLK